MQCAKYFFCQYAADAGHARKFFNAGFADALQTAK